MTAEGQDRSSVGGVLPLFGSPLSKTLVQWKNSKITSRILHVSYIDTLYFNHKQGGFSSVFSLCDPLFTKFCSFKLLKCGTEPSMSNPLAKFETQKASKGTSGPFEASNDLLSNHKIRFLL